MATNTFFRSSPPVFNKQVRSKTLLYDDFHLLQEEAQKITSWHIQTEINSKNREKVVQNLQLTVESQRKSLLEVQLEYESIGNKMQEEVSKRTACLQRIDATRDLCNLIKNQACELENTLHFCGDIKNSIECQNSKQTDLFQKLATDFQQLTSEFEAAKLDYSNKLFLSKQQSNEEKDKFLKELHLQKDKVLDFTECLDHSKLTIEILIYALTKEHSEFRKMEAVFHDLHLSKEKLLHSFDTLKLNNQLSESMKKDQMDHEYDLSPKNKILLRDREKKLSEVLNELKLKHLENINLVRKLECQCSNFDTERSKHLTDVEDLRKKLQTQTLKTEMLENIIKDMNVKLESYDRDVQNLTSDKEDLNMMINDAKSRNDESEEKLKTLAENLIEKNNLIQTLTETVATNQATIEDQKKSINLSKQLYSDEEKSRNIKHEEKIKALMEKLKEKDGLIQTLEETLTDNQATIEDQTKTINLSKQLYNELVIIRDDQTEDITTLRKDIEKSRNLLKDQENNLKNLESLKKTHAEEMQQVKLKLQSAEDKIQMLNEEESNQKKMDSLKKEHAEEMRQLKLKLESAQDKLRTFKEPAKRKLPASLHARSTGKKNKLRHFTALTGHDISSDCPESFSVVSTTIDMCATAKQQPPKHSTPIRRSSVPIHYAKSCKKVRSSPKPIWKQSTSRKVIKTPATKKSIIKEDNWFDTDAVYGFFE